MHELRRDRLSGTNLRSPESCARLRLASHSFARLNLARGSGWQAIRSLAMESCGLPSRPALNMYAIDWERPEIVRLEGDCTVQSRRR